MGMGLGGAPLPRKCPNASANNCGMDSYEVDPDMCTYQDIQKLRLQETPEDVPVGELPRHVMLAADRALVGVPSWKRWPQARCAYEGREQRH